MNHRFTKQMKDKHYFKNLYFSTLKKCQYMHIKIYGSQYIYKSCCAAYLWPMQLHIWKLFFFNVHVFSLLFSNTSDPTSILPAHLVIKLELLMTFLLLFTLFKKPSSALLFLGPHVWRCWFRPLFETNSLLSSEDASDAENFPSCPTCEKRQPADSVPSQFFHQHPEFSLVTQEP